MYSHRFLEKRPLTSTFEAEDQYGAAVSHGGSVPTSLKAVEISEASQQSCLTAQFLGFEISIAQIFEVIGQLSMAQSLACRYRSSESAGRELC